MILLPSGLAGIRTLIVTAIPVCLVILANPYLSPLFVFIPAFLLASTCSILWYWGGNLDMKLHSRGKVLCRSNKQQENICNI